MPKKRERLEIIHDILKVVRDHPNGVKPTRLLYSSNLSPQMFKDYTRELMEKGFMVEIEDKKKKKLFSLTTKGFAFLEEYKVILSFVDNFGL